MKTINDLKNELQASRDHLIQLKGEFFYGNQFVELQDIDLQTLLVNELLPINDVVEEHSNLYFEKVRLPIQYDKEKVRTMYFSLRNLVEDVKQIKTAEHLCDIFAELGALDATKRKASSIGKYFLNNVELKSNAVSKFQTTHRTKFSPKDLSDFKEAYIMSYDAARTEFEEIKSQTKKGRRYAKDAVANSYTGDIEKLITWIRDNLEYVSVKVPSVNLEDYDEFVATKNNRIQMSLAELKEKVIESTTQLVEEAREQMLVEDAFEIETAPGIFASWVIKLKPEAKDNIPQEVRDWMYLKKSKGSIEDYAEGYVFRERQNVINGNPIVKDLIFGHKIKMISKKQ